LSFLAPSVFASLVSVVSLVDAVSSDFLFDFSASLAAFSASLASFSVAFSASFFSFSSCFSAFLA